MRNLTLIFNIKCRLLLAAVAFLVLVPKADVAAYTFQAQNVANPNRTEVTDRDTEKHLATFTKGARTVVLDGAPRTLSEPKTTTALVKTNKYVRILAQPYDGTFDNESTWLASNLESTRPDMLAIAFEYVIDVPRTYSTSGWLYTGDADYGPFVSGSTTLRREGSDFNDYQGRSFTYYNGYVDAPESDEFASLDCSGFMRMVLGSRSTVPLTLDPDGTRLPRQSKDMVTSAPGILHIPDVGAGMTVSSADWSKLLPGDLLFWDLSTKTSVNTDTDYTIDHVGMYLGLDTSGKHRFISSRASINGPTMGDYPADDPTKKAFSYINGEGIFSTQFRAARRL